MTSPGAPDGLLPDYIRKHEQQLYSRFLHELYAQNYAYTAEKLPLENIQGGISLARLLALAPYHDTELLHHFPSVTFYSIKNCVLEIKRA